MGRLTRKEKCKLSNGKEIVICKHEEQDCNDSCMKIQPCAWYKKVQEKLWEYENAEEQGLLLRLPCKVGDTVYSVTRNFISEYTIRSIEKYDEGLFFNWRCEKGIYINVGGFTKYDIGKTVFLTKAEAEKKLKGMEQEV